MQIVTNIHAPDTSTGDVIVPYLPPCPRYSTGYVTVFVKCSLCHHDFLQQEDLIFCLYSFPLENFLKYSTSSIHLTPNLMFLHINFHIILPIIWACRLNRHYFRLYKQEKKFSPLEISQMKENFPSREGLNIGQCVLRNWRVCKYKSTEYFHFF